jgi:hypothetical protein
MTQTNGRKTGNRPINPAPSQAGPKVNKPTIPIPGTRRSIVHLVEAKRFPLLIFVLFSVFVLYQTMGINRPVFWKLHDQALFLTDLTFLKECLSYVGGLSVYVGSFFNEFFFYPWLGALLYTAFLLLVATITSRIFRLKGWLYPLALIPSLLLLLTVTQNGYLIYLIKLDAFAYVAVLGLLISLLGAVLGSKKREPVVQSLLALVYMLVAYPVSGVYSILGILLFVIFSAKHQLTVKEKKHLIPMGVALLALWLVPVAYDHWVFDTTNQQLLYVLNLPSYLNTDQEHLLWLPYLSGAIFFLVLSIITPIKKPTKSTLLNMAPFILLLATVVLYDNRTYKDENFKSELRMMEASENGDWNQVLHQAKEVKDEPTRLMVMYTNLALFKLDKLGNEKYHYQDGNKPRLDPRGILDSYIAGPSFFFHYGKMNYCYRWCMENTVEYGKSVTNSKYFVLSSAVNGQKELARKYNHLLERSLLHRPLSKKLAAFIENPTLLDKDPNYCKVRALTNFSDFLDSDYSKLEEFLILNFANTRGGPPEMVELCLLANMDLRNPEQFWPDYFYYTEVYKKPLPIHIQEAALLYNHIQNTNYINPYLYHPAVLARFDQFLTMVQQYAGMPDYEVSTYFKPSFGDTYWFKFSFNTQQTESAKEQKYSPYSP